MQNSRHAIGNCVEAYEVNPLYGRCPSALRYYSISGPIAAAAAYFSWRYKREDDALAAAGIEGHRFVKWHLVNDVNIAGHAVGILVTVLKTKQ